MAPIFHGEISELAAGIKELCRGCDSSYEISVVKVQENLLSVTKTPEGFEVLYAKKAQFFRALSYILGWDGTQEFVPVKETAAFETCGAMIDVSQGNSVITVSEFKNILRKMALMGLDMLMIYTEDNFVVEQEPYFGYMRGRYTAEDFAELDQYAFNLGIEIIPCIQTLAHLIDALKWEVYADMKDDDDTLLVGEEKVYTFIDKLIKAASEPLRTKRIHIGMDEAWKLGQGNYLLKNGYRSKFEIMTEHLKRVLEITKKHGLEPMIWSDMYFRAASETGSYYDPEDNIPEWVHESLPEGVSLCYWDYYHKNKEFYDNRIRSHQKFGSDPIFAGGIWNWNSYAVDYEMTFATTNPALAACKDAGIKEVFITTWGDGTTECPISAVMLGLQLLAENQYTENPQQNLKSRFLSCTGGNSEDFFALSGLDVIPGQLSPETNSTNTSKFVMWQDPMIGLFDENIKGMNLASHYKKLSGVFADAAKRNGEYNKMFEFYAKTADVLSVKSEIGINLASAYAKADKAELSSLAAQLQMLGRKLEQLRICHQKIWHRLYKPFGFEVLDIRYGGLIARMQTSASRVNAYLSGEIENLEELEQQRLLFNGKEGLTLCLEYSRMPSAGRLTFCYGF